jgi:O-antigen ligase
VIVCCLATLTLWIPAYWPVGVFEVSVFMLAGMTMILADAPARGIRLPLFALIFIVLWGCLQLVAGWTMNPFVTERATMQWMTWAALYYVGVSTFQDEPLARRLRASIMWFGFAVAVEAILQTYLTPGKVYGLFPTGYHEFVMGPIVYHTHFAVFIETILPIALFRAVDEAKGSYSLLGVSAVLLAALVLSASRGGLIIALVEALSVLALSYLRQSKARRRTVILGAVLIGFTGVLMLIVGFETASERFSSEALIAGRIQFAISTVHMIAAHPWVGWGLGCWPAVYPAFATLDPGVIVNQAHSDWLQWTAEGGLLVGLAMLGLALWAVRPAIRSIWGIGVLAVLTHALFDYPFSRPAVGAWPILILAMAAVSQPRKDLPPDLS